MAAKKLDPELIAEAVEAYEQHGSQRAAAAYLGIPEATFQKRLQQADTRNDWTPRGQVKATKANVLKLPKKGRIKKYVLTCAQSGTKLHEKTWNALQCYAKHEDARMMVSTYTYNHRQEGTAKRGTQTNSPDNWYDPRIEEFVVDELTQLAPALFWNGHMNILPTAVDPLSGLDNYNHRGSSIFPHAKLAMKSIATMPTDAAKLQFTTGTVTQRNYIQKKAGQKAEFDHVYGGLVVEVNSDGKWWVRQLTADRQGRIYDLFHAYTPDGEKTHTGGCEAIVWGDVHVAQLEDDMFSRNWGEDGLIDKLQPKYQFMHDVLDFESRSHHDKKDPFKRFELHTTGREDVKQEIINVGKFLEQSQRDYCKTIVVQSNHDRHLERWLREADWKTDPVNAEFYVDASKAYLAHIRKSRYFNALQWAVRKFTSARKIRWLAPGEPMVICRRGSGGIEMGLHGDLGPNGSRGSLRNLSRLGRKVVIGHSHSAGIFNGAWQTGVTARLDMDYTVGAPSSWSQTHCIVHKNGKRQLITCYKGRYWA